jgi:hypothetical protein
MVRVWDTRTGKTLSSFTHQVPQANPLNIHSLLMLLPAPERGQRGALVALQRQQRGGGAGDVGRARRAALVLEHAAGARRRSFPPKLVFGCAVVATLLLVVTISQERSPARVQGLGAFCNCMTFDWRGEHLVTADDNLTTGSGNEIKAFEISSRNCV